MKLKPVVASLFVLGLVSGSALAAGKQTVVQQAIVDSNSVTSPVCSENWFNRISIGGIGSVVGTWGNTDPAGTFARTDHSSDLYVNNFNILGNAVLNSWTKATVNLAYIGYPSYGFTIHNDKLVATRSTDNKVRADEAYLTFAKLNQYPVFFKIGKQYVPFGTYSDPYNFVLTPMTQMLSQTNATAATLGVATDFGLYANVYAFRGETQPSSSNSGFVRNFGGQIGYFGNLAGFDVRDAHYNVNAGLIRAMQDGDYWTSGKIIPNRPILGNAFTYSDQVAGLSLHGDLSWKQFDLSANYVSALKDVKADTIVVGKDSNTKIWAADVNAGYAFKVMDHNSRLGVSYQFGGNGQFLADNLNPNFPKTRLQADYKVNLIKHVDFDLAAARNRSYDYPKVDGANGAETSNVLVGTLSFQF